jgi:hypothetical protein
MKVSGYYRSVIVVAALLAALDLLRYVLYSRRCLDCMTTLGLPFPFFQQGGFFYIRRFVWWGLAADVATIFFVAAVIAGIWQHFSRRRRYGIPVPAGDK